jgi:hypothetical protein
MTHWVKAIFKPPEYGLGLARDELAGEEVWGHSGDILGFHVPLVPPEVRGDRRGAGQLPGRRRKQRQGPVGRAADQ